MDSLNPSASDPPAPNLPAHEPTPSAPAGASALTVSWTRDLETAGPAEMTWLWRGLLAPGSVTLLTNQSKSGKTTLLAALLARLKTGGSLLDLPVAAGKALVVSEERKGLWRLRGRRFPFGDDIC